VSERKPSKSDATTPAGRRPRVGVLGLQGDFACHQSTLEALGVEAVRVSLPEHLAGIEALVMPGGESTTMARLLESTGLRAPIEAFVRERPVLATCAGLILLARETSGLPYPSLGVLDVTVERNAYGRQIDSFIDDVDAPALGAPFHAVFIRAPRIRRVGPGVEVVARHGNEVVGVRAGRAVGLAFHPELTQDLRFHRWFLETVAGIPLPALATSVPGERAA
jgi:5'-phosphate synthase pdxT subunit